MFHTDKGLFFQRQPNGDIRIIKTYDERDVRPDNVVLDQIIPETVWGSVVSSVSREGETYSRWMAAREFHGLRPTIEELNAELKALTDSTHPRAPQV